MLETVKIKNTGLLDYGMTKLSISYISPVFPAHAMQA